MWASLANGTSTSADWDTYLAYLDGAMNEHLVVGWDGMYASPAAWEGQVSQAEQVLRQGKAFLAVGQAP